MLGPPNIKALFGIMLTVWNANFISFLSYHIIVSHYRGINNYE